MGARDVRRILDSGGEGHLHDCIVMRRAVYMRYDDNLSQMCRESTGDVTSGGAVLGIP